MRAHRRQGDTNVVRDFLLTAAAHESFEYRAFLAAQGPASSWKDPNLDPVCGVDAANGRDLETAAQQRLDEFRRVGRDHRLDGFCLSTTDEWTL
jgi:hypothetical protein